MIAIHGRNISLEALRQEAKSCTRCDLYKTATQTVFGEGAENARVVFVGEQPGDREDLAGQLFDSILEEVGIDRRKTYVTNAVKHFKFTPRGKRRIHAKPNAGEIRACNWWLEQELALLRPDVAVALGATAVKALTGKTVAITRARGEVIEGIEAVPVFVTVHPSYLLRIPDRAAREEEHRRFTEDMRKVRNMLQS